MTIKAGDSFAQYAKQQEAARAMLAALRDVRQDLIEEGHEDGERYAIVDNAIARAEAAGITS